MYREVRERSSKHIKNELWSWFVPPETGIRKCLHDGKNLVAHLHLDVAVLVALKAKCDEVKHHLTFEDDGRLKHFGVSQMLRVVKNLENNLPGLMRLG
jgi:hypothetical protein